VNGVSGGTFIRITQLAHIGNITSCQEDLGNGLHEMGEQAVPETHQSALTDGCKGLQLGEMFWSLIDVHPPEPNTNGSRRDDDDLVPIFPQFHSRFHYRRQDGK
jgi:hypothetical protein